MDKRFNTKLIFFQFPFFIDGIESRFPAGEYTIETEEEVILGSSFLAYRNIETTLVARSTKGKPGSSYKWSVDHDDLEKIIKADFNRHHESGGFDTNYRSASIKEKGSE